MQVADKCVSFILKDTANTAKINLASANSACPAGDEGRVACLVPNITS